MQVILKEDVDNLGKMGDTVNVKLGYARNFLFPRSLAVEASAKNLRMLEQVKKEIAAKIAKQKAVAQKIASGLSGVTLTIKAKAGEEGKLFGSVTNMDIEEALKAQGFEVDKRKIVVSEPIKNLGSYTVTVKLPREVTASVTVNVEAE